MYPGLVPVAIEVTFATDDTITIVALVERARAQSALLAILGRHGIRRSTDRS